MMTAITELPGSADRQRILAIDDDPSTLHLMQAVLSSAYDVAVAASGEEGLKQALASPPDLILTDLEMPGMTGQELVRHLRGEPRLQDVPVIVLTGWEDAGVRLELLRSGAQDFLIKPFGVEELRVRIANLIRIKRARELLQHELQSREGDINKLIGEVAARRAALQTALETTRLARDQAQKADEAKTRFLTLVSHEFKTPLTILGLVFERWLRRVQPGGGSDDKETRRVKTALARLKSIVDGVVDYTNIQSGDYEPHREPVDLMALIDAQVAEFDGAIAAKGLRLEVAVADEAKFVTIDPRIVGVILSNLIGNAVSYTDAGTLQVQAFIAGGLVLTVRDSGRGIDDADCKRIFQPFEHSERIENKSTPGIGLGLTLVRDLANAAGGQVTVQSAKGIGSTFTVKLPLPLPLPSETDAQAEHPTA